MLNRDGKKVMAAKVVADGDAIMIVVKGHRCNGRRYKWDRVHALGKNF